MRINLLFPCFVAVTVVTAVAETAPDTTQDTRIARVERGLMPPARIAGAASPSWTVADRMAFYHVPGISVAVIDQGSIAWTRGYGVTRAGDPNPVTPDTLFQAASLSKAVTAAAVLTLVDAGKVDLDADVNTRLRSWKIPPAAVAEGVPVTLRQLLSHTAGMTIHGFGGYAVGAPRPTLVEVLDGRSPANSSPIRLWTKPGTQWRYSGGGYCVVQQLLLDLTDEDFPTLLRERVLIPAGMTASTFAQPLPAELTSQAAAGHTANGQPIPGESHVYPELAAAGLWTTAGDLARFLLALQRSFEAGGLLTRSTATQMFTPPPPSINYGLGLGVEGAGKNLELIHNGANEGFRCFLVAFPRLGRGAIVMTNSENGVPLAEEILRALSREYEWPGFRVAEKTALPLAPETFDSFVGRYEHEDSVAAIFRDGTHFYFQVRGQLRREIFASSDHTFFQLNAPDTLSFERNAAGVVTYFVRGTEPPQIFQRQR